MEISIGSVAIDRGTNTGNSTSIDLANPANASGVITTIEVWLYIAVTDFRVGTFYHVSGITYKCRDSAIIGSISSGSKQIITQDSEGKSLAIAVEAGDFIGFYTKTGWIECDVTGGVGILQAVGVETIDPGDEYSNWNSWPGYAVSLYGIGEEELIIGPFPTFFRD